MTNSPWADNTLAGILDEAIAATKLSDKQAKRFHSHVTLSLQNLAQALDDEGPELNIFQGMNVTERLARSYGHAIGLAIAALVPEEFHGPGLPLLREAFIDGVKDSIRSAFADGLTFTMKETCDARDSN